MSRTMSDGRNAGAAPAEGRRLAAFLWPDGRTAWLDLTDAERPDGSVDGTAAAYAAVKNAIRHGMEGAEAGAAWELAETLLALRAGVPPRTEG